MADTAQEMELLRKDFDETCEGLKKTVTERDEQIKELGAASKQTGKELKAANEKWESVQKEAQDMNATILKMTGELENVQKKLAREQLEDELSNPKMSCMEFLVKSKQFEAMVKGGDSKCSKIEFDSKDIWIPGMRQKAIPMTSTDLGAAVQRFRWDQIIETQLRPARVADLITHIPVSSSNAIEYPEETVVQELYAELAVQAGIGTPTLVVGTATNGGTAEGFYPGQTVTLAAGAAAEESHVINAAGVVHATWTITLATNLAATHAIGISVTSDTFVYTPEAQIKPKSKIGLTLRTANILTLATIMAVTTQMLKDSASLQAFLEMRMGDFVELSKERQLLYGANTTREIAGILTNADINTLNWSAGTVGDTKIDAIRRAVTLAILSFLPPDGLTIHPTDWEDVVLTKGDDGHYIFNQIPLGQGITQIWRLTVVETSVIDALTALIGNYRLGAVIWDREQATVSVSDQNKDWWEKNMVGIRVEERMQQSIIRPTAFVNLTFNNAPV